LTSAALVVTGAVFLYSFEHDQTTLENWTSPSQRAFHTYSELQALDARRHHEQLGFSICLGAAVGVGGVAAWRW
jgi:hypothetical protein